MTDNSNDQVTDSGAPPWAWLFLVVIVAVFVIMGAKTLFSHKEKIPKIPVVTLTETLSCETWERMYGVVESHTVSSDIFKVGSGDTWVVPLDTLVWSDWMMSSYEYWWLDVKQPRLWLQTPDDRIFRVTPEQYISTSRWKQIRFRGDGCILFTTNESVFARWNY